MVGVGDVVAVTVVVWDAVTVVVVDGWAVLEAVAVGETIKMLNRKNRNSLSRSGEWSLSGSWSWAHSWSRSGTHSWAWTGKRFLKRSLSGEPSIC